MAAQLEKKSSISQVSDIVAAMKERALEVSNSHPSQTNKLTLLIPENNFQSNTKNANDADGKQTNTLECSLGNTITPVRCPTPFPDDEALHVANEQHEAFVASADYTTCTKCGSKIAADLMRDHFALCNGSLEQTKHTEISP